MTPISATGVRGPLATVQAVVSAAKAVPAALGRPAPLVGGAAPAQPAGGLRVWAYPDTEKADPVTGDLLEDAFKGHAAAGGYRSANPVWAGGAVRLAGARNEFVAFQLLIEATKGTAQRISVAGPMAFREASQGAEWKAAASLYRDWYVKDGAWFPEACVPLSGTFDIPAPDNGVPNQRNQSVFVEFLIPPGVAPGLYHAAVTVSAERAPAIRVPVDLAVNSLTLPNALGFDISLNSYGTMGGQYGLDDHSSAYRALEREYHRMAHLHRTTFVALGYSHTGNISTNYAPPLKGHGADLHVSDWSAWDAQFGPYLDGSAFAGLPRGEIPITHFYLPFHEAWPVDIRAHYSYQPTVAEYPAMISEHAMKAPPIEDAIDPELAAGFKAVVKQFAEHFKAKGWTHTSFQFYNNDKYFYKDPKMGGRGTSWWLLDEPYHRDDWLALAFFARLFREGTRGSSGVSMLIREDISRPQWQRDYLDGLVDLMVVSDEFNRTGSLLQAIRERQGVRFWNYGSANAVRNSNTEAETWAVRAWLGGADAIVPWQTVGEDDNYIHPDETALLLPGKRFGIAGPVASLRLKALRRAQQDAEYLLLLARDRHWERGEVAAALRGILTPTVDPEPDDATAFANLSFGALRASDFADVRRAIADAIRK